jgi:hypothetical protein
MDIREAASLLIPAISFLPSRFLTRSKEALRPAGGALWRRLLVSTHDSKKNNTRDRKEEKSDRREQSSMDRKRGI